MNTKEKKIIFIPGFPYSLDFYKRKNGLNIWVDKDDFEKEINAPIVIGHSLGADLALMKYNDAVEKIVLFNPVIGKKNYWQLFIDWTKHGILEKTEKDKSKVILNFLKSITSISKFVKDDYENILQNIPTEKIVVYHGVGDKYLCDENCLNIFRNKNVKIIEVENADHNWSEIFDQEIEKIINN